MDLKIEQEATLARPRMAYKPMARMLFWGMDVFYGKPLTLRKVQLLEILARIPYQAWELRQYLRMTHLYEDQALVEKGKHITAWAREAQDNEFWHLLVVNERMSQLGIKKNWFWDHFLPRVAAFKYRIFSRLLSLVSIESAFYLNAQFEDHAEHEYMQFVKDHPELDSEKVDNPIVREHGNCETWGDVFRRIGLDEREHMNNSLVYCGLPAAPGAEESPPAS